MDPKSPSIAESTYKNSNIQNTKQKLFDNTKPYFQGIICNRDQRESGKKRYFWTQIILVILIISIVLIIVCITLGLNANNNWWVYLIFGSLGVIGCTFGHYYNTKTYIENSKYDIDIDDIAAFIDIKNAIKKTINTISLNQKEIDNLNRQINIIIGKNKAKAFTSSIASSTSKGLTHARQSIASSTAKGIENAKSGISSLASSIASSTSKGLTQARQSIASSTAKGKENPLLDVVMKVDKSVKDPNTNDDTNTNDNVRNAAGENDPQSGLPEDPNKLSVLEDPQLKTLKEKLNVAKENLESNKTLLVKQMKEYNKLKEKNDDYKEIKMANQHNKNIIYNISDFYDDIRLLDDIKSIDIAKLNSLNINEPKIVDEYTQMMNDINTIKTLNTKSEDISIIIQNINLLTLKLPYLQNIKNNMLANYMEKFITYMDILLIEPNIDEYFTISKKYSIIFNNLNDINKTHVTDKYNKKLPLLKEIYTNISKELLKELKEEISLKSYDSNLFTKLDNKYKEFVDKQDILDYEKLIGVYNDINTELLNGYVKYVTNQIDPKSKVLTQETQVEPLRLFIKSVENDESEAPGIQQIINEYNNHPLLIGKDKLYLKNAILKPFREKLAKLEKAKAEADAKANTKSFFNFT